MGGLMKKSIYVILFIVLVKTVYSQSLIFPELPSDQVNDLYFLNSNEIILINNGGGIYKSYDGGTTWKLKTFYPGIRLSRIYFLSDGTGFITSKSSDDFFYSKDLGESWDKKKISTGDAVAVLPFSENIIVKSVYYGIARLNNFYNNWELVYRMPFYTDTAFIADNFSRLNKVNDYDVPYGTINKFQKLPSGNVIALADNGTAFNYQVIKDSLSFILRSKDSCLTWDTLWIGLKEFIKDISFIDDQNGWMISDTSLFKTTNGGVNWEKTKTIHDTNYSHYASIYCKGNSIYILTYGSLLISTNSGITWTDKNLNQPLVSSVVFNDINNGFVIANELLKTTDAGQSWETLNPYKRIDIFDLDFISTKEGIAISNNGIYKTYDGGHSWTRKFVLNDVISNNPGVLKMISESDGWLITYRNIYKTTDRGESWNDIPFPYHNLMFSTTAFYDENLGLITATEESVPGSHIYDLADSFITTDGGKNWKKFSSNSKYFTKLKFTDPKHLWGISQTGMWVSYDTAATWKKIYGGDYLNGSFSFDFCDSLYGVITISGYEAFLTTDGGNSWKVFNKPIYNSPSDCKIIGNYITGSQRIMETGNDGKVLITYLFPDGRIDYSTREFSSTGMNLNIIDVFVEGDFPYVWIGGYGFSIVYRQYEKIISDVKQNNYPAPSFALTQNYPNPFNPSTTIEYTIPAGVNTLHATSLRIFDILGREITTLVNENKPAGSYSVTFNVETLYGASLPSGIYFYQLRAGDYVETKKMLLLK
jgi:photosystem II stability/assembly factor-like uncharacterized protein